MSVHIAKAEHEVAYQELAALVNKHASKVSSLELLAIAANLVGKIVALQDQRTVTPAMAMKVVAANLKHGNLDVLAQLAATSGTTKNPDALKGH
jgi:divalent metal cation (Fe/Co/Zn/Cd) transporter